MPRLAKILIYPVKSLDGLSVPQCPVLPSGALQNDRRFALRDSLGEFINGKREPAMHCLRLHEFANAGGLATAAELLRMEPLFPASEQQPSKQQAAVHQLRRFDRALAEDWLRQRFLRRVTLVEHDLAGFPDDPDAPGPTVVSTATLQEVAEWFPGLSLEEVRARFRANLEVDGVEPFWEDRLYAAAGEAVRFAVGSVILEGVNPCQRCAVPTRTSTSGEVWPQFAKIFARRRKESLPGWAVASRFDHYFRLAVNTRLSPVNTGQQINVGDTVQIC
ncbi:MAG: MOSC domain-containing protein [Pirellulales bacterium]